jgi:hypothetical protein
MGTFKLTQELPSVLAQTSQPTTTPTPQSTTTSNSNSDLVFLLLNNTNILTNILLWISLIGVFVVLFSALSPITGSVKMWWTGDDTKPTLKDKADFLVQALPKISESITIVLVIIVVTALTVSGQIKSEGTISILSSIIGFVLGKKAAESSKNNLSTPTTEIISLSIKPEQPHVKFGDKLNIKIDPAQELESYEIEPPIGKVKIKDQSTLVYDVPSKPEQGNPPTEVTITVTSRTPGIPPATAKIKLID